MAELAGIGQYSTVDPLFVRSIKAEQDAIRNLGYTQEYIDSRGGINASGYYGDSWKASENLTPEEYDAAIASASLGGFSAGEAINYATDLKRAAARGISIGQYRGSSGGGGAQTKYIASDGSSFSSQAELAAYQTSLDAKIQQQQQNLALRTSAFDELYSEMASIGLASLVEPLRALIQQDVSPSEFRVRLAETKEYKNRFIANEARIAKGLQALTPAAYMRVEDGYRQILREYGLTQFDTDKYVTQFIENDISPTELSSRVQLAVQRVQNADPAITTTLKDYYGLSQQDLVGYILDPKQQLPSLERKVSTAEIGAAARRQGLEAGTSVAEQLAAQGVSKAEAEKGYAAIADILPTAEKLSAIYAKTEQGYGQTEAEQEYFNQLASAQRKRQALRQREIASFSGESGVSRSSLGGETSGKF